MAGNVHVDLVALLLLLRRRDCGVVELTLVRACVRAVVRPWVGAPSTFLLVSGQPAAAGLPFTHKHLLTLPCCWDNLFETHTTPRHATPRHCRWHRCLRAMAKRWLASAAATSWCGHSTATTMAMEVETRKNKRLFGGHGHGQWRGCVT